MKLKPPTNVKGARHFLGLTGYYWKFICNYADTYLVGMHPLNCLTHKAQPFKWAPECQAGFDMLHLGLTNTPIVQLHDPKNLIYCSQIPANFVFQVCLPRHPLQTPMKLL